MCWLLAVVFAVCLWKKDSLIHMGGWEFWFKEYYVLLFLSLNSSSCSYLILVSFVCDHWWLYVLQYRLADTCVAALAYLEGTEKRVAAGQVGQTTVQNLQTILEYFDSSDVQNLKVRRD
jgi:hypothetical protein